MQSAFVQQLAVGMHMLLTEHSLPLGHPHEPPGEGQVCPGTVQSVLVQQFEFEMHASKPVVVHALNVPGQAH